MPRIEFRGRTYNSEFEMPADIRQAYQKEKEREARKGRAGNKPLSELVDMSPEVKALYERALGNVEEKLGPARATQELPRTEDIYRQSAPHDMKHLPSDESIYRPSQRLIDPGRPVIEPEPAWGASRLLSSILWVLLLAGAFYLITQFLL